MKQKKLDLLKRSRTLCGWFFLRQKQSAKCVSEMSSTNVFGMRIFVSSSNKMISKLINIGDGRPQCYQKAKAEQSQVTYRSEATWGWTWDNHFLYATLKCCLLSDVGEGFFYDSVLFCKRVWAFPRNPEKNQTPNRLNNPTASFFLQKNRTRSLLR